MGKIIRPLPLAIVYITIIFLSLRNPSEARESLYHLDKLKHFAAYLTLSLTIFITITGRKARIVFLVFSFILSIIIEIAQESLTYRKMEVGDGLANTLGLFSGVIIYIKFKDQITNILKQIRLNTTFLYEKQKEK